VPRLLKHVIFRDGWGVGGGLGDYPTENAEALNIIIFFEGLEGLPPPGAFSAVIIIKGSGFGGRGVCGPRTVEKKSLILSTVEKESWGVRLVSLWGSSCSNCGEEQRARLSFIFQ